MLKNNFWISTSICAAWLWKNIYSVVTCQCDLAMSLPRLIRYKGWACPRGPSAPRILSGLLRYNEGAVARLLRGKVAALQPWPLPNPGKLIRGWLPPHSQLFGLRRETDWRLPLTLGETQSTCGHQQVKHWTLNCTASAVILLALVALTGSPKSTLDETHYWDVSRGE